MKIAKAIIKEYSVIFMSFFYIYIGILHFVDPEKFLQIMPPYLPFHLELVYLSGFFEIVLGALLIPLASRLYAAYGIILLLIAVFPANIYLAQTNGAAMNISPEIAWGRLPFQLVFIGLAIWHSKISEIEDLFVENIKSNEKI